MLFVLFTAAVVAVAQASPKGGQCYDCNYAPDGIVKNSNGTWAATKNDVFHHCALASSDNANYINKRNCISGRCFVRKDENGMVFRGCADQWNLPWGIDTSKSCEQQAYQGSVWWFCDGDLCNAVNIEAECGAVPVKSGDEDPPAVASNIEVAAGFDPDHEVAMGDSEGGVMYAYPAEPLDPGYETVHGQEYAYWKDPPKRKRRPINRKSDSYGYQTRQTAPQDGYQTRQTASKDGYQTRQTAPQDGYQTRQTAPQDGYQTRQTAPQDDVYYSRISGQHIVAEPVPEVYLPVPQPESHHVLVEPVAFNEAQVFMEPQPEVAGPAYQSSSNYWWNYFPFNYYNNQHSAVYPAYGYQNTMNPWESSYAQEKPKLEQPKPVVNTYKPNPKRTEVNIVPAKISSGTWKQKDYPSNSWVQSSYKVAAPEPSYKAAPESSYYAAPEPSYVAAPEPSYIAAPAPKMSFTKPQAIYKIQYEAPAYVAAPEPVPEQPPVEYHSYQTNDDTKRRDYYADRRHTDTGIDRPYVYFAERNDPYATPDERGQTRLDNRVGARCYECNFAPSGYVAIPNGPPRGRYKEVGYMKCGLQTEADRLMVDQWVCPSSTCFIRRDPNGMVYRGCADRENLPFNVQPGSNCKYEGKNNALWYFCNGDLCNDGQLGEDADHCGSSPPPIPQSAPLPQPVRRPVQQLQPAQPVQPVQPVQSTYAVQSMAPSSSKLFQMLMLYPGSTHQSNQYPRVVDTYDFQAETKPSYPVVVSDYSYQTKYQPKPEYEPIPEPEHIPEFQPPRYDPPQAIPEYNPPILYEHDYPLEPPPMPVPVPEYPAMPEYPPAFHFHMDYSPKPEYQHGYYPQPEYAPAPAPEYNPEPEYPVMQYSPAVTSADYSIYNPCTGNCRENPSGLFADPSRTSHFIQCGCDIVMGTPCTCCKPYYMECPQTMMFDDKIKVCVHS